MTSAFANPYSDHTSRVEAVRDAGGLVPQAWDQINDRFLFVLEQMESRTFTNRLNKAVLDPTSTETMDLPTLLTLALAQSGPSNHSIADLTTELKRDVTAALVRTYRDVAAKNYQQLAAAFDGLGYEFESLVHVIDPETPAANMISAPDDQRSAWVRAEMVAHELTASIPALQASAQLLGMNVYLTDDLLALVINPDAAKRRAVWDAWESDGRTGHWAALLATGAVIRTPDPDTFKRYRRPQDFVERHVSIGRGQDVRVVIDPEEDEAEQLAEHRRRLTAA